MDLNSWAEEQQGKTYRENAQSAIAKGEKAGVTFIKLSKEERQRWVDKVDPVNKEWVKEMDAEGMPGTEIYNDILKIVNK